MDINATLLRQKGEHADLHRTDIGIIDVYEYENVEYAILPNDAVVLHENLSDEIYKWKVEESFYNQK